MNESVKPPMSRRALTSTAMLISFLLLPLSGIPLHFSRTEADPGVLEHFLMSFHNASAFVFVIATAVHLSLNWSALKRYVVEKTTEYFRFRRELIIAFVVVVGIVFLFSSHALHVQ